MIVSQIRSDQVTEAITYDDDDDGGLGLSWAVCQGRTTGPTSTAIAIAAVTNTE
jgi:hypothetical protein